MKTSQGFTAVELLVTLFVAAAFLIAGFQLFTVVVRDGGETRAETKASQVAYEYLGTLAVNAPTPCADDILLDNEEIAVEGLVDVRVTATVECVNDDLDSINRLTVTITYNNPTKTVQYATFVPGATSSTYLQILVAINRSIYGA